MFTTFDAIADSGRKLVEVLREREEFETFNRFLTDLYPDTAHFVYELLQNAEDARASEVRFILYDDRIEFEHDGKRLFSLKDVECITSIGKSPKRGDATAIGKFGVGFKAVFAYTEMPEIHSGDFHFRIRDMVVPEPDGLSRSKSEDKQTRFTLPFNNPKKAREQARSEIERLLKALDATTLLFLSHIRKIEYLLTDSSLGYIERIDLGENRFEIRVQQPKELTPSSTWFLKFDKEVQVEDEEVEKNDQKVKSCCIAVAFGLTPVEVKAGAKEKKGGGADIPSEWELKPMEQGRVCIYFPADKETSNLRFHIHAPFASTVARDSVRDCAGNNALRDHLADLLAESMSTIRDQGLLTVRALAALPNDKEDNLTEFYQPLIDRLVEEFKEENLVPMKRGGHAAAVNIFQGTKILSDLIDDEDMVTLLGDGYATPIWTSNPPQRNQREDIFLSMLGIKEWKDDDLVSALSKMDNEMLAAWMGAKTEEWHQRLYAYLEDHADELTDVTVIRCSDGTYRRGNECFFPTDGVEHDDKFPRVAQGVYFANKEENKKARDFLKAIRVREMDERVEIESILASYYTRESETPNRQDHYSHLRRFMRFLEENPGQDTLFEKAYLFMVDREENICWMQPSGVYLDAPYMDTGLSAYYEAPEVQSNKRPLSRGYEKSKIALERIGAFAVQLDAQRHLVVECISEDAHWDIDQNPQWFELDSVCGNSSPRSKRVEIDWDGKPDFKKWLESPTLERARLVWRSCLKWRESDRWHAIYQKEKRYGEKKVFSQLVHTLRKTAWVPQKIGKKTEFVQPRDAVAEKMPEGFVYQTGWQWLRDLEFGKGVEVRQAEERREKERQSQEYKRKEQIAKDFGFDSLEEAKEMANDKEEYRKWKESQRAKPSFPQRSSADPDRRRAKAAEIAAASPEKMYEKRELSKRTSRPKARAEEEEYLRDLYTNDDAQLICQICRDEMPFRKKDGRHYFEKIEAFDLPKEHSANNLALCPVCAAKYDEFVHKGADDARDKLKQAFVDMGDADLELPVILDREEPATIRFVENHAIDLRAALKNVQSDQ